MRHLSLLSALAVVAFLAAFRLDLFGWGIQDISKTLTWDAFGYYLYLPGKYIYHDLARLEWLPQILDQYHPTGQLYQTCPLPNGNFAMKYLMGLSILYTPFFFAGHWAAGLLGLPQDGFSAPYCWAVAIGNLAYALAGLLLLRRVLLRFFSEKITALTLLAVGLASNWPQYAAVESGMTHGYLFGVYALALWLTVRWHERPSVFFAALIGLVVGLASITRPTEGVMLFLPLLWQMPAGFPSKWQFFRQNPTHLAAALAGGFLGILPQLLYWKAVTGSWIYDVGAKFLFFRPHWQVLFGWEKGWFVYTPITIFMVAGLFLMRGRPFQKSVLTYAVLNIWVIIAWADWHYGATYSCRALVQSYPVMALPLALVAEKMLVGWRRFLWLPLMAWLAAVNVFQLWQYNRSIIHYRDMNRAYYGAIFLNPRPTPAQMSLLDTGEFIADETLFLEKFRLAPDSVFRLDKAAGLAQTMLLDTALVRLPGYDSSQEQWLRVEAKVQSDWGAFETNLVAQLADGQRIKRTACRMHNGICALRERNVIAFYFRLPADFSGARLSVFAETTAAQRIVISEAEARLLEKKK